jgi:DivIVA domain-containing protein
MGKGKCMPLTPDEVAERKFTVVYGRGYARNEVDDFLAAVASDYRAAIEKIAVAAEEASSPDVIGEEVAAILQKSRESAKRIMDKARADAKELRTLAATEKRDAEKEAKQLRAEASGRIEAARAEEEKLRAGAMARVERDARARIEEADKKAFEILGTAKADAAALLEHAQKRSELQLQIDEQLREKMAGVDDLVQQLRALLEVHTEVDLRDAVMTEAEDAVVLALEPESDEWESPTTVAGRDSENGETAWETGGRS